MILVILAAAAVLAVVILLRTRHEDKIREILWRVVPSIREMNQKLSASRVAGVLSMMLSGGFRTEEALERAAAVLDDRNAAAKVDEIRSGIEGGKSFAEAISDTNLFRDLDNRMIRMGWTTGREDQVLGKLSDLYEEQAEQESD